MAEAIKKMREGPPAVILKETKKDLSQMTKEEIKKQLKRQRDIDRQKVKGIFRFHEVPNGIMKFVFRKWDGDPIENYTLEDGKIYELPLGVAKHLNQNCWYPVNAYALGEDDKPSKRIGKKVRRCSFQSLEFVDEEDFGEVDDSIVTVEKV